MTPGGFICGHLWMIKREQGGTRDCPIHSCERPDPHTGDHRCACGALKLRDLAEWEALEAGE